MRAVAYGFSAQTSLGVKGVAQVDAGFVAKEIVDRYESLEAPKDTILDSSLYFNAFDRLSKIADSKDNKLKIIVFVDDLDRCFPKQSVKLLESIKLVLAQRGFIFVLAVDRRIIEGYLNKVYKEQYGIVDYERIGSSYLDKIVQLPLNMPSHQVRFTKYIDEVLKGEVFKTEKNREIRNVISQLKEVLAIGSKHNPRSLVRFLNNLIIDANTWEVKDEAKGEVKRRVTEEFLGICAVSRILQRELKHSYFNSIVSSQATCNEIVELTIEFEEKNNREERIPALSEVVRIVFQSELLNKVFRNKHGKNWLEDEQTREDIHQFLIKERGGGSRITDNTFLQTIY